jgi:hypothetical protein
MKVILLWLAAMSATAQAEDGEVWYAGAYSFSSELGGFRILGVTGSGSRNDPFVIEQELQSASPVTLVIRATTAIHPFALSGTFANGFMYLRLHCFNNSGLAWTEFEFELQEIRGQPSVFGDGLSFDQRKSSSATISSDSFREFDTDFEPFDRLLFRDGAIDPLAGGRFGFLITDFTPEAEFYLLQDPRIPSS